MKPLFFSIVTLLLVISSIPNASSQSTSSDWASFLEDELYQISLKKENCSDPSKGISKEYLFLKIDNKHSEPIKLTYKIEKWYDGVCSNCDDSPENPPYTVELNKDESTSGSCENYRDRNLAVFSRMTGNVKARRLTNFKIIPLKINDTNIK